MSSLTLAQKAALRTAITLADQNVFAENVIELSGSITLTNASAGQLKIENDSGFAKTLTIEGQGSSSSDTVISGVDTPSAKWNTRIFEIEPGVTVILKNLEVKGGHATDGGDLGGTAALGGGILIDGGQVTLSGAAVESNLAVGVPAASGGSARPTGANAEGGGIYLAKGQLTLLSTSVFANGALGTTFSSETSGGDAKGGGIYVASGQLNLMSSDVTDNSAIGDSGRLAVAASAASEAMVGRPLGAASTSPQAR